MSESRLDIEIFLVGDIKLEFLNFLAECYKTNFTESLSWGTFRRFQLSITNNNTWLNIFFVLLKNDEEVDLIINSFKIFEKRSPLIVMYNAIEEKSEKTAEELIELFKAKKEKMLSGIGDENILKSTYEKIYSTYKYLSSIKSVSSVEFEIDKVKSEDVKERLSFIEDNKICYKIGFISNSINKKTKLIRKSDNNNAYSLDDNIFHIESFSNEPHSFKTLLEILLQDYLANFNQKYENLKFSIDNENSSNGKLDSSTSNNSVKSSSKLFHYMRICLDCTIALIIAYFFFKSLNKANN